MTDPDRMLRELAGPDPAAQDRAWRLVGAAYARRAHGGHRRVGRRLPGVALVAAAGLAMALSPAGANVLQLVREQVAPVHRAAPRPAALSQLPGGGTLLVATATALFTVGAGRGVQRIAGATDDAAWSAFGNYVVTAARGRLTVYAVDGRRVWSLAPRAPVRGVRWSPDGNRIAYASGATLRVVAGDGTGDRELGPLAAPPAWRPRHDHQLVYAVSPRVGALVDADSGRVLWRVRLPAEVRQLAWSADGRRLLAVGAHGLRTFDSRGRLVHRGASAPGQFHVAAAPAPTGHGFVLLDRARGQERVSLVYPAQHGGALYQRPLLTAAGIGAARWSPDGRWILVDWRQKGTWLFLSLRGRRADRAVDRVASHFADGEPVVAGWCCGP